MFDTIYKRTSAGKIQQWTIEVSGNKFRSISGQTDGKKQTAEWTLCFGKNLGKANATTDQEQALLEAQSKFDKKLEKHYHRDINNADEAKFVKAMLAHKYGAYPTDFSNTYSQPKLDGMRCLVTKDGMFSRGGKPILSAPHIFEALKPAFELDDTLIFDGELYASHLRDDFEKLISLAKKSKPKPEDLVESAANLEYWVYDLAVSSFDGKNDNFHNRYAQLTHIVDGKTSIVPTPTEKVRDQEHMDELYAGYLADGQEGQMLRKGDSLYEGKRSKNLLKRKEFIDEEYEVVAVIEGQGNWTGYAKAVTCLTASGQTFNAGIKGNREFCKKLLDESYPGNGAPFKYNGGEATIRFQNLSSDGIPRFPVMYHMWEGGRNGV